MTWFIGQSILIIAAAFLLGILVGWLIWGRILRPRSAGADSVAAASVASAAPVASAEPAVEPEPVSVAAWSEPASDEALEPVAYSEPEPEPEFTPELEPVAFSEPEPEPEFSPELESVAFSEPEPEPEPTPEPVLAAVGADAVPAAGQPERVVTAQAAGPQIEEIADDLERIEGIGPKMAGALNKAGIRTYAQLAAAGEGTLRHAIESEGLRFAPSLVTWSRQAQLLADGDEAGFEDLTRRLVAGRDVGRE